MNGKNLPLVGRLAWPFNVVLATVFTVGALTTAGAGTATRVPVGNDHAERLVPARSLAAPCDRRTTRSGALAAELSGGTGGFLGRQRR